MEFTDEEVQNILETFKALKVKPKADTPEDFAKWLADFTASMGAFPVKEEQTSSHATTSIASGHIHVTFPHELRISVFSGDRLKQTLKDVSGHKFDSHKTFDELRVALRRIESEHKQREDELKQNKKTTHLNMASTSTTSQTQEISELKDLVQQLSQEVKCLKENTVSHLTDNTMKKRDRTCWRCGQVGHIVSACRVRLDHSKRDLNSMRPMAGGKQ
ncbi:hypothetical protein ACJMK2_032388 [Sinanodonta woodiana]|uniref:CCHC-type domain-containing protein n=1 Tax=Sinanodonta woodiana TaxID=1069815 RepID=A0ABD3X1J9_SINWO